MMRTGDTQETRNAGPLSSADTTTKETTARLEIRLAREAIWETVSSKQAVPSLYTNTLESVCNRLAILYGTEGIEN